MRSVVASLSGVSCRALPALMALAAVTVAGGVQAQTVDQVLDSIVVTGPTKPQGVVQSPTVDKLYYTSTDAGGESISLSGATNFEACQNIGTVGLFCLGTTTGGAAVLRWDNPDRNAAPTDVIKCADLGLAGCTAMTVNLAGNVFVAGPKTGATTYALVKVSRASQQGGTCSGAWASVANAVPGARPYCYRQGFAGRPRIYDLTMVDGPLDDAFLGQGAGVLALEDPTPGQITFYPDREQSVVAPVVLVAKNKWGNLLASKETLQGLTLLQDAAASPSRNFFIVSTSTGKVLGYQIDWSLRGSAFNTGRTLTALSLAPTEPGTCAIPTTGASYDLRASARTRRTFFVAGSCIAAYDPVISTGTAPVTFPSKVFGLASDFTLASVTVSPGIEIDFIRDGCQSSAGCNVIMNGTEVAARLHDIDLDPQVEAMKISGWVVYLVKGLPDCRYIGGNPAICNGAVLAPAGAANDPTRQYLNITKLLPPEITDTVPVCTALNGLQPPDCLPAMWLQPDYRARKTIPAPMGMPARVDYTFDALFGIPERGLIYRDTFNAEFDIGDLFGNPAAKLGCGMHDPIRPPLVGGEAPPWDVVVNISELAPTVGGPAITAKEYVSVLVNSGCTNPTRLTGGRGSAFVYGLERAPNVVGSPDRWYDATFALLMRSLARDYDATFTRYACAAGDSDPTVPGSNVPPINPTACYNLNKAWVNTYDKLLKCVGATDQPKNSAGSEACTSFETQFEAYKVLALADAEVLKNADSSDRYNRVGEFLARTMVLSYVYYEQFKRSIKAGGFVDPN
jgi:hypothetical protein